MKQRILDILLVLTIVVLVILYNRECTRVIPDPNPVVVHDTIKFTKDSLIPYAVYRDTGHYVIDSFPVVRDSTIIDSVQVPVAIPIYKYAFKGEQSNDTMTIYYNALVSGYAVTFDSLLLGATHSQVIKPIKKKKWGFGPYLGVGVGIDFNGQPVAAPTVGFAITYDLFSW